jgi:membrane associated rhomboid family serine protease
MAFQFYALKLTGIIILVFLAQAMIPGFTEFFLLNQNAWNEPWRFVTSIFLHGNLAHLVYNMFALALFGTILEVLIREKRFLFVFFSTGILANLVSVFFYPASLGASGAIFGIIGAMIYIKPWQVVWAFGLPMPVFIAGILWAVGDMIGIFVPDNVGNIAHLSGMAFGLLVGSFFRRHYRRKKERRRREKHKHKLDEDHVRRWEDAYLR